MKEVTRDLLREVSEWTGEFPGAYNVREDGASAGRRSTENIQLSDKPDGPGLVIRIRPGTKGETVSIPALVTHGGVDDLVYNDFFVGEGADVTIVAGCGVHTEDGSNARHNGIHRFFLEKNAHIVYLEKHLGTGHGTGLHSIDPVTEIVLGEGAVLEMDTSQIGGVDRSTRRTTAVAAAGAKLIIRERLLTEGTQQAKTDFSVQLDGEDSGADIISRSVARGKSRQQYRSRIVGNNRCTGHSECDAIIGEEGAVDAAPALIANHGDAALIHEAAIGKIAGEQLLKLRTLGLTEEEAEARIVAGFLK